MAIDDSLGLAEFRGNAIYKSKDSLSFDLMANNIKTDKKKSILLATELPTLLIKQKKDTLYVTADTLYSAKISDLNRPFKTVRDSIGVITDTSLNKYFEAFHNIKLFVISIFLLITFFSNSMSKIKFFCSLFISSYNFFLTL